MDVQHVHLAGDGRIWLLVWSARSSSHHKSSVIGSARLDSSVMDYVGGVT